MIFNNLKSAVRWKKGAVRLVGLIPKLRGTPAERRRKQFKKDKLEVWHRAMEVIARDIEEEGQRGLLPAADGTVHSYEMHVAQFLGDYPEVSTVRVPLCNLLAIFA